jgi:ribosomal protein S18 acetylase RimI-like enzyme
VNEERSQLTARDRREPVLGFYSHLTQRQVKQLRLIYEHSFPPEERQPFESLVSSARSGGKRLLLAESRDGVVGFAVTGELACDVWVLDYLAVRESERGSGIGGRLLREITERLRTEKRRGLLFEVEPEDLGSEREREQRRRRIRFYKRAGAQIVRCAPHYCMPSFVSGRPFEMTLMWLSGHRDHTPPTGQLLRCCVKSLLEDGYGLPGVAPLIRSNLDSLVC